MTTTDQTDRLKCADMLLSGHYRDITAKDIALSTAYSLADIAESLRTIADRPEIQIATGPLAGTRAMPGDLVEAAIEIMARATLATIAEDAAGEWRERYPDIGEHDWQRVGEAMMRLAPRPPGDKCIAAYGLLEGRADHE